MIVGALMWLAVAQAPLTGPAASLWETPVAVRRQALARPESLASARGHATAVDTPVVRRERAVEYSDAYFTRLTIHRIGSYTMLPLFAAEYSLGQNLLNDASPPTWMKPAHAAVAGGLGILFGVNTVTGLWNLWDARQDPAGRTRRTAHSVLMLASDAGFALTAALAPSRDHGQFVDYATYLHRERVHRGVAIGAIAVSTIGGAMMWFWKQ